MNEEEHAELKSLLAEEVASWERQIPDLVIDDLVKLDSDRGTSRTTEAEIVVFGLPRRYLYKLHVARWAYEYLIGIITPEETENPRVAPLIRKARSLCPPARYYDQEFPFELKHDEPEWYQWFAQEFSGLDRRHSHAFWHKIAFNLDDVTVYRDGEI